MKQATQATEEELKSMAHYGITHEVKSVYLYEGHKYDKLSDALRYARINSTRETTGETPST
jgi:hypothetical protein